MSEELKERVGILESKVAEHTKLLEKQQERNETQTELNTILRMNVEQMKRFGETLDRVDENLTNLNNSQQQLNINQHQLGERVTEIETTLSHQKVDIVGLVKSIFAYALTAAGGIVVAYIYLKFGIK